eukprot:c28955_g1_i1 orf=464-2470(+)
MKCDLCSPLLSTSPEAVVIFNDVLARSKLNAGAGEVSLLFTDVSDVDGDVSDASSSMGTHNFELKNRGHDPSSPVTNWANERRLDVSRAMSECSSTDDDDGISLQIEGLDKKASWCAEDLKLEMEVKAAECNLLRVQKELASCISLNDLVNTHSEVPMMQALSMTAAHSIPMEGEKGSDPCGLRSPFQRGFYKIQPKEAAQNSSEGVNDMSYSRSSFAREARRRLRDISNESACKMPQEDPTFVLQNRLQNLLLAAREHQSPAHSASQLEFEDMGDTSNEFQVGLATVAGKDSMLKDVPEDKRCLIETAALRKELDLMSLELAETKAALASQKTQTCSCLGRHSQQTVAEEMYCKETIQRIVQQVQSEIEQWSQMQDILHNLREELEGLSETQKLWEERALRAEAQLTSLQEEVHEWRCRAQSGAEELVLLRCEKQIMKNKIDMMEEAQMNMSGIVREVEEKPRCASVWRQHEDLAVCESFVHSRNESGRSSVDLGTTTQGSFRKSIRKSINFASRKENGNASKFRFGNIVPKVESMGLEFPSKKVDENSEERLKNHKANDHFVRVNPIMLESSEPKNGHDCKERKKARLFASKENKLSTSTSTIAHVPFNSENVQNGLPGVAINVAKDYADNLFSSKPKSSLPSAPTSTPSRLPFGDIVNISRHDSY